MIAQTGDSFQEDRLVKMEMENIFPGIRGRANAPNTFARACQPQQEGALAQMPIETLGKCLENGGEPFLQQPEGQLGG